MRITYLNKKMFLSGMLSSFHCLQQNSDELDRLNVFPVPDGDTGFNMVCTFKAGINVIPALDGRDMRAALGEISKQMLMASRGNSGVILSQFYRGMVEMVPTGERIEARHLAAMLEQGCERSYTAVTHPVEGTMLTIIRGLSEGARKCVDKGEKDIVAMLKAMRQEGYKLLYRTPEMLPVLAAAGVVDAGGKGVLYVFEGILNALEGKQELVKESAWSKLRRWFYRAVRWARGLAPRRGGWKEHSHQDVWERQIKHRYCTEFLLDSPDLGAEELRGKLVTYGDSLEVVRDSPLLYKIHLHTNQPEEVIKLGRGHGKVERVKIDDIRAQQEEFLARRKRQKGVGVLAVSPGAGFSKLFLSIGADHVVTYGRHLPSARKLLRAVNRIEAGNIFLLANHKNIIPVAQVVAQLAKQKKVSVVPSDSAVAGIVALYGFSPEASAQDNEAMIKDSGISASVINIARAERSVSFASQQIKRGEYMALSGNKFLACAATPRRALDAALADSPALEGMMNLTIYHGKRARPEEAKQMLESVRRGYPKLETELVEGGQYQYEYIVALE